MNHQRERKLFGAFIAVAGAVLCGGLAQASGGGGPPLKLVQTIELKGKAGKMDHLVVDSKSQRLFLANKVNNTLDIVDLKAGKLLNRFLARRASRALPTPPTWIGSTLPSARAAFATFSTARTTSCSKPSSSRTTPTTCVYNPRTSRVYVAHEESSLGVIDAKTFELKADIKLPGAAEAFQLETGRPRLYLNAPSTTEIVVIDTDKNAIVTRYPIKLAGKNQAMALDEANHRLFIGCRAKPDGRYHGHRDRQGN